jgi:chemotaxis protein MotA
MNLSFLIGAATAIAVFLTALFTATPAREIFLDVHGILIVVGGTTAATLLCFPVSTIPGMIKVLFRKIIGKYGQRHEKTIAEIVTLASAQKENPDALRQQVDKIQTEFLKEAVQLLIDGGLSDHQLDTILAKRANVMAKKHTKEASIFKTIAKFPPAFGLMGTTIGMVALLQSLGSADAYKKLGPSMAIGLVATLYGIALANFIFIPISENLTKLNSEDELLRAIVIDGVKLLRAQEHPLVVSEYLISYLTPSERKNMKKAA